MTREIPVTQARSDLADLVNRVAYSGERVMLTRHGKPLAALVPVADLEALEGTTDIGFAITPTEAVDQGDQPESAERRPVPEASPPNAPMQIAARYRRPGD